MEKTSTMHQVFLLTAGLEADRGAHLSAFRCIGSGGQEPCLVDISLSSFLNIVLSS